VGCLGLRRKVRREAHGFKKSCCGAAKPTKIRQAQITPQEEPAQRMSASLFQYSKYSTRAPLKALLKQAPRTVPQGLLNFHFQKKV
jgi:hypothetical protein